MLYVKVPFCDPEILSVASKEAPRLWRCPSGRLHAPHSGSPMRSATSKDT